MRDEGRAGAIDTVFVHGAADFSGRRLTQAYE